MRHLTRAAIYRVPLSIITDRREQRICWGTHYYPRYSDAFHESYLWVVTLSLYPQYQTCLHCFDWWMIQGVLSRSYAPIGYFEIVSQFDTGQRNIIIALSQEENTAEERCLIYHWFQIKCMINVGIGCGVQKYIMQNSKRQSS